MRLLEFPHSPRPLPRRGPHRLNEPHGEVERRSESSWVCLKKLQQVNLTLTKKESDYWAFRSDLRWVKQGNDVTMLFKNKPWDRTINKNPNCPSGSLWIFDFESWTPVLELFDLKLYESGDKNVTWTKVSPTAGLGTSTRSWLIRNWAIKKTDIYIILFKLVCKKEKNTDL